MVDASTAMKIDSDDPTVNISAPDRSGVHIMRKGLMSKTNDVGEAVEHRTPSLRRSGEQHDRRGIAWAVSHRGIADHTAEVIDEAPRQPKLFITGGDPGMITAPCARTTESYRISCCRDWR